MLIVAIAGSEFYDETTETFSKVGPVVLNLEHSLVSLSKWESEYQKPFLGPGEKTTEEVFGYIKAMMLGPVEWSVFGRLTNEHIKKINDYIESPQSATTFGKMPKSPARREVITSELIYYWMVGFQIPFECENWHLNRLFALIRICNLKQQKPKRMSKSEMAAERRALNAQRRADLGTTG